MTYLVQVEGAIDQAAVNKLEAGIVIAGKLTLPARGKIIDELGLPSRSRRLGQRGMKMGERGNRIALALRQAVERHVEAG